MDDWEIIGPTVEKIVNRSAHKHVFYHFTKEDIAQQIVSIALEAYKSYRKSYGPLENFLARSISNRLKNLKRDNHFIVQIPCIVHKCEFYDKKNKCCLWDKAKCFDWRDHIGTYNSKRSINSPSYYPAEDLLEVNDTKTASQIEEMLAIAKSRNLLCVGALEDFIKLGKEIPEEFRNEVTELVLEVARE